MAPKSVYGGLAVVVAMGAFFASPLAERLGDFNKLLSAVASGNVLERNDDGSAKHPELFQRYVAGNETILKSMSKEHPDWVEIIRKGNVEEFQTVMRAEREEQIQRKESVDNMREENKAKRAKKVAKCMKKGHTLEECELKTPASAEPQIRRMKMMGPHVTEDDQYNRQAPEVPMHMRCDACQAVAHQGATALAKALAERKKDDKVSLLTIETLETTCYNMSMWMYDYGYSPGSDGINALVGPGVSVSKEWWAAARTPSRHRRPARRRAAAGPRPSCPPHACRATRYDEDGDLVVPNTQHSDGIGRRMGTACSALLLGVSPDEDEIASLVLGSMGQAGDEAPPVLLRKLICDGADQPCAGRRYG